MDVHIIAASKTEGPCPRYFNEPRLVFDRKIIENRCAATVKNLLWRYWNFVDEAKEMEFMIAEWEFEGGS